ncbi:nucleotidyltransferase [Candidatus Thiomargarita nelsonii]|uniref:Nucleotidyltransferase n=1 Tax=Candidatus Thiomargarita nelsonii TaxID=1003181 RepID=A0A0A6P470_9GAMM|nr:nucleotidyltransferase [Candidatus Thiomargarita nelsonii]
MERLKKRLEVAKKALMTLQELENKPESKMRRDATIQRFEYSFEAMWKAAKQYLNDIEGLDLGSPKGVIRGCFQVGLLTQAQTRLALAMTDDRNLTSHTYNESLADNIFSKIKDYHTLMSECLNLLETNILSLSDSDD